MGIWLNFIKGIVMYGLEQLYTYIDKNKDGIVDSNEVNDFIADVRKLLSKIKNKGM